MKMTWLRSIIIETKHIALIETIHYRSERWPSSSTIISQLLRIKWTLIAGIHFWIRTLNAGIFRFKITTLFAGICQRKRTLNAGTRGFLGSKLWPFSRVFLFAHCIKGLIRSSTPGFVSALLSNLYPWLLSLCGLCCYVLNSSGEMHSIEMWT